METVIQKNGRNSAIELLEGRTFLSGYTATDLGLYRVAGLNESGAAAGSQLISSHFLAAVRDKTGKIIQMGVIPGTTQSYSKGLNQAGDVVGYAETDFQMRHAFIWKGGKLSPLPELSANGASEAMSINDSGTVAGGVSVFVQSANSLVESPVVWLNGKATTLGPAGTRGRAYDVNNAGTVVGGGLVAFIYSGGKYSVLPTLAGGFSSSAFAVNDSNQIVGEEFFSAEGIRAILWSGGQAVNLGTLAGTNTSFAEDINNSGVVVGQASGPGVAMAFMWTASGQMVDLNSLFPGAKFKLTDAVSINNRGQILAVGQTADGGIHTYILSPAGITVPPTQVPTTPPPAPPPKQPVGVPIATVYSSVDLKLSRATRMNELGMIATVQNSAKGSVVAAMSDSAGRVTPIGALSGGSSSFATDIDEANEVVGDSVGTGASGLHTAFLWHAGKMSELLHPAGQNSMATAMNDAGAVVGSLHAPGAPEIAALWAKKRVASLGTLGGKFSHPTDINNLGQIVGQSSIASGSLHPFMYTGGKMIDLQVLAGGASGNATAINDAGAVVGSSYDSLNKSKAVLWLSGKLSNLGTLSGDNSSVANDINKAGTIVGQSSANGNNPRAFMWTAAGHMVDLNSMFHNTAFKLTDATSIDDKGQIVVIGKNSAGIQHVFLLTPQAATVSKPVTAVASSSRIAVSIRKPVVVLGSAQKNVLS